MSAARHLEADTAGIAECVTEDHLPSDGTTAPARRSTGTGGRSDGVILTLLVSNNSYLLLLQLQTATTDTANCYCDYKYCYCDYELADYGFNCEPLLHPASLEPFSTTGSSARTGSWRETRAPSLIGPAESAVVPLAQLWTGGSCPRQLRCSSLSTPGTLHTSLPNV